VGNETVEAAAERRLPTPAGAGEKYELAVVDIEADIGEYRSR
jgi:hypothetical protein